MKDLTMGLSHIAYCDTVEIDTLTNNRTDLAFYDKITQ